MVILLQILGFAVVLYLVFFLIVQIHEWTMKKKPAGIEITNRKVYLWFDEKGIRIEYVGEIPESATKVLINRDYKMEVVHEVKKDE